MAIAYDTSGVAYSVTSAATVNLTAAGANELAVMFVWFNDGTASFSSITVNGSSTGVTLIGAETDTSPDANKMRMYYLVNPPTSSVAYTVNLSGTPDGMMWAVGLWSGVDTSTPIDSSAYIASATTPFNHATTVVASDCWLAGMMKRYGGTTIGVDTGTQRAIQGANFLLADSNGTVATGSQSLSFTTDATYSQGMIVSLKPTGASSSVKTYNGLAVASVKTVNGLAIASVKTKNGLA